VNVVVERQEGTMMKTVRQFSAVWNLFRPKKINKKNSPIIKRRRWESFKEERREEKQRAAWNV